MYETFQNISVEEIIDVRLCLLKLSHSEMLTILVFLQRFLLKKKIMLKLCKSVGGLLVTTIKIATHILMRVVCLNQSLDLFPKRNDKNSGHYGPRDT